MAHALRRPGRAFAALLALSLVATCALVRGAGPVSVPPTSAVIVDPALFVGMVEVVGDARRGRGVLVSTASEEVVVANDAMGRTLMHFEGELVAIRGRLIDRPRAPLAFVVREFRVLGIASCSAPRSPISASGVASRASARSSSSRPASRRRRAPRRIAFSPS